MNSLLNCSNNFYYFYEHFAWLVWPQSMRVGYCSELTHPRNRRFQTDLNQFVSDLKTKLNPNKLFVVYTSMETIKKIVVSYSKTFLWPKDEWDTFLLRLQTIFAIEEWPPKRETNCHNVFNRNKFRCPGTPLWLWYTCSRHGLELSGGFRPERWPHYLNKGFPANKTPTANAHRTEFHVRHLTFVLLARTQL